MRGIDTEMLLAKAHKSCGSTRIDGRKITRGDVNHVWETFGDFVSKMMKQGKPVLLPKFGTFTFGEKQAWMLTLAPGFLQNAGLRQRRSGKPRVPMASKVNFIALSKASKLPREVCKKVIEVMMWNLAVALSRSSNFLRLAFPGLGVFTCKNRSCDFVFGAKVALSDDSENDRDSVAASSIDFSDMDLEEVTEEEEEETGNYGLAAPVVQRLYIPESLDRLREKIKQRGGANGINSIARIMRIMDDSGDKCLSREEFTYGLRDFGISMNSAEIDELFTFFDRDRSGKISFDELLVGLRGPLSKRRLEFIKIAFNRLDHTGDGVVTIEDLEANYDGSQDPDVKAGTKTPADALRALLANFDTIEADGIVTAEEFEDYYKNVSASINSDDYFELMMRNAWHISGGKGQTANTTNRRVLVTHADGTQTVEEIKDDLFMSRSNESSMRSNLKAQGIHAQGKLGFSHGDADETEKLKKRLASVEMRKGKKKQKDLQHRGEFGDQSLPPSAEMQESGSSFPSISPLEKLGKLLREERLSVDDFLLKMGANRVVGSATIDCAAFKRGLTKFDRCITVQDADEIVRLADSDQSGTINVEELCAHLQGAGAVKRIKKLVLRRAGSNGIVSLTRILRNMDSSRDNALDRRELQQGFATLNLQLTSRDVEDVFAYFDRDRSGKISVGEFLIGVRGELNGLRKSFVLEAFKRMDRSGDGVITIEDLAASYDVSQHPDFKSGKKTKAFCLREFLDVFDSQHNKDGIVTEEEFLDYFKGISASIDRDDEFELMMRNAWHISGGKGRCANTSNRRVLVTDAQGQQKVREVENDLFVGKDAIRKRLGVSKGAKVDYHFMSHSTEKPRSNREAPKHAWGGKQGGSEDVHDDPFALWGGDKSIPGSAPEPAQKTKKKKAKISPSHRRKREEPVALQRLRDRVAQRGGTNGIHTLGRVLKIMDDSGDKSLDREELRLGLQDYGVECSVTELNDLFEFLDVDKSGKISFDEFLIGLRGPIPERRLKFIRIAFDLLDRTGDGHVSVEDLEMVYDPSFHPEVRNGKMTKVEALKEFLKQFDTIDHDGIVTEEEFEEYYKNVSASIDSDDYFELMMRNAWHISGGSGQIENTTNRRVLVTQADGRQSVEEIKDDLWMSKDDQNEMKRRLREQGIDAKGKLGMHYAPEKASEVSRGRHIKAAMKSNLSLAWDTEEPSAAQKLNEKRLRERKIRTGAAARVQAIARARKARKDTEIARRQAKMRAHGSENRVVPTHRTPWIK